MYQVKPKCRVQLWLLSIFSFQNVVFMLILCNFQFFTPHNFVSVWNPYEILYIVGEPKWPIVQKRIFLHPKGIQLNFCILIV